MSKNNSNYTQFCDTISALRAPNGCPWDRKQTIQSLKKYIREETDELLDAIEESNPEHICEEAGDIMFLIALLAEIHKEKNQFTLDDILSVITQKMIRRHPHVFAGTSFKNEEELNLQWEKIKNQERNR